MATRQQGQRGFAYLWLLFLIASIGASLAAAGVVWEVRVRREKEADLLFIGAEIRRAIADYHRLTPQAAKELPARLEDLLEDKRGPALRRHLRRLYRDPLTGRADWGLVKVNDRIMGVYSQARGVPIRQDGFSIDDSGFKDARRYTDWRFVATVNLPPAAPQPGQGAAQPTRTAPSPVPGVPLNTPAMPEATPVTPPATAG